MQRTLLLLLIAASYILFAGGPRWTLIPLSILMGATVLSAPRRTFSFPRESRTLDLALAALVLGILLQISPLPASLVATLSPHAASVRAVQQFGGTGDAASARLSVKPAATEEALVIVVLGILSFWSARGVFHFGGSTRKFCRALALLGGAAAISALVFRAVSPGLVHGMLEPTARSANPFGAFVNRNHFGGWLLLIAGPVWGYLIAHLRIHPAYRQRFQVGLKQFLASGALVTAMAGIGVIGVLLMTLSRSAAAGLGAAAIVGWRVGRHRLRIERTNLPTILAIAGVVLLVAVLFVDVTGWMTRIEQSFDASSDRSRLTIWREVLPVVRDFWLTGTGAGTIGDAMVTYQQSKVWVGSMSRWAHFNNAHSHYLQVAAEGGLLLALPALIALVEAFRIGRRAVRDDKGEMQWARIGAAGALVGMGVQSLWETSLILPANAILCGVVAGLALYQRPHHPVTHVEPTAPSAGARGPR